MKNLFLISFALLGLTFTACTSTGVTKTDDGRTLYTAPENKQISEKKYFSGHITDSLTGKKISNAKVELKNANLGIGYYLVKSDSGGYFEIKDFIPNLNYVLEIAADGYIPYRSSGSISAGETSVSLQPEGIVTGVVSDSSGSPVKGAEVRIENSYYSSRSYEGSEEYSGEESGDEAGSGDAESSSLKRPGFAVTDDKGVYRIGKLVSGAYSVTFMREGYIKETIYIQRIKTGQTFSLPMKLFRGAVLAGKASIAELNVPAANISVSLTGKFSHTAATFEDGSYRIEDLKPGTYEVRIYHPGFFEIQRHSVQIKEGSLTENYNFTVEPRKPEIHISSYRYTFSPGNELAFEMRTFRLESADVTIYRIPLQTLVKGKNDPDAADPVKDKFPVELKWKEGVNDFQPYEWRYQTLQIKKPLPTGGYCIEVKGANNVVSRKFFTVTSIGTIIKRSRDSIFIYATDLITNAPVANATVAVYDSTPDKEYQKKSTYPVKVPQKLEDLPITVLATGKTDANGILHLKKTFTGHINTLAIAPDGSYALCATGSPAAFEREKTKFFIYTDRPVYRSGDTVFYKAIAKTLESKFIPLSGKAVYYKIQNSDTGRIIDEGQTTLDEWGTLSGKVKISEEIGLGTCEIFMGTDKKNLYGRGYFFVEQYRKPEFKIEIQPSDEFFINGDTAKFKVEAKYFFGAPLKNAVVKYRFYETKIQDFDANRYYDDGMSSRNPAYNRIRLEGVKPLDDNGIVSLKLDAGKLPYDREITLEATVTDNSNVSITSSRKIRIGRGEFYIKIKPDRSFYAINEKKKVTVETVSQSGRPVSTQVKVELYRYIWKAYQRVYIHDTKPSFSAKITTDAKGTATVSLPENLTYYGEYDVVAQALDRRDNEISANRILWVYGLEGGVIDSKFANLELDADKIVLDKSEEVTVLIKSKFTDAYVCLTLEGKDIYQTYVVKMKGNITPVKIPVKSEYAPNFYLTATMQRGRALYTTQTQISIPTKGTRLYIALQPDKKIYLPGEKARVKIKVTDVDGNGVKADLSLATVDESIFYIRPDHTANMQDFFYSKISNWVLTTYSFPINLLAGAGKEDKIKVRTKFDDTTFWKADIKTDSNGDAVAEFVLPDNLTTWRLTARAHDRTGMVGELRETFMVTQDLIARIGKPRFFIEGDQISVIGIVNSNTARGLADVTTVFTMNDTVLKGNTNQKISLPPYGTSRDYYKIDVPKNSEKITLTMQGNADKDAKDAVQYSVPVERRGSQYKLYGIGDFDKNKTISLEPLKSTDDFEFVPEKLYLSVNPSPVFQLLNATELLAEYPYGCIEQTLNKFMPLLAVTKLLETKDASYIIPEKKRKEIPAMVNSGISRLATLQNDDGTWGWWAGGYGNEFITGYALYSYYMAEKCGYKVNASSKEKALYAINGIMDRKDPVSDGTYITISYDALAYLLFIESAHGWWNQGAYNKLMKAKSHTTYQTAFMVRALCTNNKKRDDAFAKDKISRADAVSLLVKELTALMKKNANGVYWESSGAESWSWPGADTEITAHALSAYIESGAQTTMPAQIVSSLSKRSKGGMWISTKETASVIYAVASYLSTQSDLGLDPMTISFNVNGTKSAEFNINPKSESFRYTDLNKTVYLKNMSAGRNVTVSAAGNAGAGAIYDVSVGGTLYFKPTGFTSIFKSESRGIQSLSNGIQLFRSFSFLSRVQDMNRQEYLIPNDLDGKDISIGDEMLVKVRFVAQDDFEYLALEDYLPSGFEVIKNDAYDGYSTFDRAERWDNRMVFFFSKVRKGEVVELAYIIRAELPGKFMVRPSRMECMYEQSIQGWSSPTEVEVKGK